MPPFARLDGAHNGSCPLSDWPCQEYCCPSWLLIGDFRPCVKGSLEHVGSVVAAAAAAGHNRRYLGSPLAAAAVGRAGVASVAPGVASSC